jgi:HK97 family phage prohead protease
LLARLAGLRLLRKEGIMPELERRALGGELRTSQDGDSRKISGYAAVFNSLSEPIGGLARGAFRERVSPQAFARCLRSNPDIRCLWNHSPDWVLGRTKSGTLRLAVDQRGLRYECDLPVSTLGDSVWESIRRQDVSSSSIGFTVLLDSWDDNNVRTLRDVELFDAGPVAFPAYGQTTATIRSVTGTESVKIGWYKAQGLRLPLSESEMRAKVRKLREEFRFSDPEDDEDIGGGCTCDCAACESGQCSICACNSGCTGVDCASDDGENCNCAEHREMPGRMKPPAGRTIYPPFSGPLYREQLQKEQALELKLFQAREVMKRLR